MPSKIIDIKNDNKLKTPLSFLKKWNQNLRMFLLSMSCYGYLRQRRDDDDQAIKFITLYTMN